MWACATILIAARVFVIFSARRNSRSNERHDAPTTIHHPYTYGFDHSLRLRFRRRGVRATRRTLGPCYHSWTSKYRLHTRRTRGMVWRHLDVVSTAIQAARSD
jgi:hypothetical protein